MKTKAAMTDVMGVRVGQVWEDCETRMTKRRLTVLRIEKDKAVCRIDDGVRATRIALKRFRANSTGYRLVK
jgi:hypothetical protein